jgi:hypothetical protein
VISSTAHLEGPPISILCNSDASCRLLKTPGFLSHSNQLETNSKTPRMRAGKRNEHGMQKYLLARDNRRLVMQRQKTTVLSSQEPPHFWCRQAAPNCGPNLERNLKTGTHSLLKCGSRFEHFFSATASAACRSMKERKKRQRAQIQPTEPTRTADTQGNCGNGEESQQTRDGER